MVTKVSRRFALGVVITALGAGPLVIIALRKKKPNLSPEEAPYDNISVNPDLVQTDLSPEELQDAVDTLLAEREMWLKFRGVSGSIKVIEGDADEGLDVVKPTCEGFIRLTLDNVHIEGDLNVYPFAANFAFSKTKEDSPLTEFVTDRNNNIRETKGEKIEGMEPDFLTQLLVTPLEMFVAFSNRNLRDILTSLWSVKKLSSCHWAFNPTDTPSSEGFFAPEMEFDQGHLVKFVTKRMEGQPFTEFTFGSPVDSNGFFYPSRICFTLNPNGNASAQEFHLTVILSDLSVVVG